MRKINWWALSVFGFASSCSLQSFSDGHTVTGWMDLIAGIAGAIEWLNTVYFYKKAVASCQFCENDSDWHKL